MKTDILKDLEFIEPIISDTRQEIQISNKVNFNKGHISPIVKNGTNYDKLTVWKLCNNINSFILTTGRFISAKAIMLECELKHCMDIPPSRWGEEKWLVMFSINSKTIYIDPLASRLEDLDPDMPDIYIGECLPPYATSLKDPVWYRRFEWLEELDIKIRGKICDWLATKVFKTR